MNISELINFGSNLLKENKIKSHILDAEILLSKTLNKSREDIIINFDKTIDEKYMINYKNFLERRIKKEPIAYIIEEKEFWSKKFYVDKNTLIPRPETEILVDKLLRLFNRKKISILDVGTGSGCIILSLLNNLKYASGIGIDVSKNAISIAKKNGNKFDLQNRLKFMNISFQRLFNKKFDLIVSNPPYIEKKDIKNLSDDIKRYEPIIALDGGNDGLDLIKKVIYKSKSILKIKGTLALEIGNEQIKKVSKILFDNNFRIKHVIKDYKNNVRCVIANYNL
jgi:release factor glutamine methyltransferase